MGLPYLNDIVYKFFLYSLYDEIIDEEKPKYRRIENDTYSFKITTYANKNYQKIINYFIRSEIEQAVGRARLLKYDCTVFLYSGFPAEQAEISKNFDVKIENEDKIEVENAEEKAIDSTEL